MDKTWKLIADKLPKQPCDSLIEDIMQDVYDADALGESLILYHREPVEIREPLQQTMTAEDFERRERNTKHRWGAHCTCSNCGEDWMAGYVSRKGHRGIVLDSGEDGVVYTGYSEVSDGGTEYFDGETLLCPFCWNTGIVTHRSELRSGRTYQILQAEVVSVDAYTVVMYWLVSRHLDDCGSDSLLFYPSAALLVDLEGKLRRFRAKRYGREITEVVWTPCSYSRDPMQMPYYSWDAENHRKVGGWTCDYGPDLDGHTGEKTALDKYIGAGGCWPGAYLHVWQQHPQVENLMRQGFAETVTLTIDNRLGRAAYYYDLCDAPPIPWVDWSQVKPNRMLHMSKAAFREISKKKWGEDAARCWDKYRHLLPDADVLEFETCREKITAGNVENLLDMVQAGWEDLQPLRVVRYLEKQELLEGGTQHLIDYRKMLRDTETPETEETLWPKDLMAAHERLTQAWAACRHTEYHLGFTSTYIRYKPLEWTDGDLCIVLPQKAQDLVDEGKILRHCVGGYSKEHCSGKPIFFVRHYRRPERSYYTLQINMTGQSPHEIQLHGYGNEHHGENKQHRHKIPRKVREFCDRWECEVLRPWFAKQRMPKEKPGAGKKKEGTAA